LFGVIIFTNLEVIDDREWASGHKLFLKIKKKIAGDVNAG